MEGWKDYRSRSHAADWNKTHYLLQVAENFIKPEVKAITNFEVEYLHSIGKMPDWAYYQKNGRTAQENYILHRRSRNQKIKMQRELYTNAKNALKSALDDFLFTFFQDFSVIHQFLFGKL